MEVKADDFIGQRLRRFDNLKKLRSLGIDPYPAAAVKEKENAVVVKSFASFQGKDLTLAGRLIAIRNHGKIIFGDILDQSGKIQISIKKDALEGNPEKGYLSWEQFGLIDEGDFIQVTGNVDKTKQGQVTLFAKHLKLLSKSLRPLPIKFDEKELRFRRRYLDLTLNPGQKDLFLRKSKFWQVQRDFMRNRGFVEVETPVLEHVTGGADARPFTTHHNELDQNFYLRISTELYQKRLIGAGLERIFTLGPNFRNEGISDEHLQEYYQIEWYWAYADYRDNMKLVRELIIEIARKVYGKTSFTSRGHTFNLEEEWRQIDYPSIIKEKFKLDIFKATEKEMLHTVKKYGVELAGGVNRNRLIDNLWKIIRKDISGPAFLVNIPKFLSPLAKSQPGKPELTQRFQVILAGSELGNGYSEINDPEDQLNRFLEQQELRNKGDQEAQMLDIDYVEMLEWGMPPVSGYGQSERLFWFLEDISGREGTLFPQLRAETDDLTKRIYQGVIPQLARKNQDSGSAATSRDDHISHKPQKTTQPMRISRAIRSIAYELIDSHIKNKNLLKHCLAVEAAMKALARHFGEDESTWGLAGLLHDADWEETGNHPHLHTRKTVEWMKEKGIQDPEIARVILSHNFEKNDEQPPKNRMEWALYTCDELTGIIVATALIMPSRKLSEVNVGSVMKKFNSKSFAAAVNRNQIRMCEEKLGLKLDQFTQIILDGLKSTAPDLGL